MDFYVFHWEYWDMSKKFIIAFSCFLLAGCAVDYAGSNQIYTSEGKKGYALNCSGASRNWGLCYQKAGTICKERGYEVLEVTGEAGTVTAVKSGTGISTATTNTTYNRIMIIQCRLPETKEASPTMSDSIQSILN